MTPSSGIRITRKDVGDVRYGSVKGVASAVGEGSACVQAIHRVLAEG